MSKLRDGTGEVLADVISVFRVDDSLKQLAVFHLSDCAKFGWLRSGIA